MERRLEFQAFKNKKVLVYAYKDAIGDILSWMPSIDSFQKTYKCILFLCLKEHMRDILEKQYPNICFLNKDEISNYKFHKTLNLLEDERSFPFSEIELKEGLIPFAKKYFRVNYKKEDQYPKFDLSAPRQIKDPYVCISTSSTKYLKLWNNPIGWSAVIDYLETVLGYRVFTIGKKKRESYVFDYFDGNKRKNAIINKTIYRNTENFTGDLPLQDRINLIKDADFFIGNSAGLSWLAWGCKIPVVMISGFTEDFNEFYTPYRVYPECGCRGCNSTFNMENGILPIDAYRCKKVIKINDQLIPECSMNITPQMVIDTINKIPIVKSKLVEYWKNHG